MNEPVWLTRTYVEIFHEDQLRINGGLAGERDPAALDAALARPINLFKYESADLHALASCYAHGIAKSHAFLDGNKRAALAAAAVFLDMNGFEITLSEPEATRAVEELASSKITQEQFAQILRKNSRKISA